MASCQITASNFLQKICLLTACFSDFFPCQNWNSRKLKSQIEKFQQKIAELKLTLNGRKLAESRFFLVQNMDLRLFEYNRTRTHSLR